MADKIVKRKEEDQKKMERGSSVRFNIESLYKLEKESYRQKAVEKEDPAVGLNGLP